MKILVMGAGAIGSVFGGFLAKGGHEVTLLGRAWHLDAVRRCGLGIAGIWGEHRVTNLSVATRFPEGGDYDLVLLSVKSYQTRDAVSELSRRLSAGVPILSLQNGLGNVEAIAEVVGPDRTLGGRVIFGAEIPRPGEVTVTVYADPVVIGPVKGSRFPDSRTREIAAMIGACGIPCEPVREIESYIWGKVLYNAALNAPAAVLGINYGRLLEQESTRELIKEVVREAFAVARAQGVSLSWSSPEAYLHTLFYELIPPTAGHYPSMLQDIRRGKKTEIQAMNGAIVALGREQGIATPVNQTLTRLILFREADLSSLRQGMGPTPA